MKRSAVAVAATAVGFSLLVGAPSEASVPAPSGMVVVAKKKPKKTTKSKSRKKKKGSLRVVAQGIPQGRSAKITVAGKKYRKKLPRAGKLRNLRPGKYRVWAAPIVADGGTAAVPDLPVRVKVGKRKSKTLRLQYTWNPRNDSYPPSAASGLEVTQRSTSALSLRWANGSAPDLQGVAVRRKQGASPAQSLDDGRVVETERFASAVVDTGLRPHTTYSYSVFMVDVAGNASRPVTVTARTLGEAEAVTAGTAHTCALVRDEASATSAPTTSVGGVECWGDNEHGQIGDGTTVDARDPAEVGATGVIQVVAGGDHTCARQDSGALLCWGANAYGQVGQPGADRTRPVAVDLPDVTDVAAGHAHTCAVLSDGSVQCWGRNDAGQLGVPASDARAEPLPVPGIGNAVAVTAGYAHTCAVLASGSARCWGGNDHGQLGNGTTAESSTPVRPQIGSVRSITAGVFHTCALLTDQSVECWGDNSYGQLGDGTLSERPSPTTVNLPSASQVVVGAYHSCAVTGSAMRCWGRNSAGRLGDGTQIDRATPVRNAMTSARSIAAGAYHSCAVAGVGVQCWGSNDQGQLGTGDRLGSLLPVAVPGL